MSIIRPPVTGDFVLDSFLNQLVSQMSQTAFATANLEQSLLSVGSTSYSATLYLYKRSSSNTIPTGISSELEYVYTAGELYLNGNVVTEVDGWHFGSAPDVTDGDYYWQTFVHISSDSRKEKIPFSSWSTPELVAADLTISSIPNPTHPTNIKITQVSADTATLSWDYDAADVSHAGLYAYVEYTYPDSPDENGAYVWEPYAYLTYPSASVEITGLTALEVKKAFRVRTGNVLINKVSNWGNTRTFSPKKPNNPTNLSIIRDSENTAVVTWDYVPNFSKVQFFELEVAYTNGVYDLKTTAGGAERSLTLDNMGTSGGVSYYRIRAHGFNQTHSAYSNVFQLDPLTPTAPVSVQFTQTTKNEGQLSWDMVDNVAPLSHYNIEASVGNEDSYTYIGSAIHPSTVFKRSGLAGEDDTIFYRIQAVGINRNESEFSESTAFIPGVPNAPVELTYSRLNEDEGKLSWDYEANFATVRNFIIQVAEAGTTTFSTAATVDGEDRDYLLQGMSVRKKEFDYRVVAVSTHGSKSSPSASVRVSPASVYAPTNLTAQVVAQVGTISAVKLSWTPPNDQYNQYSIVTAQLYHDSDNTWKDVATVPAASTSVEFQPSRQGTLAFRVRATAANGISSVHTDPTYVYIAGGSATDNAIYNGDSAFLASKHYSVNTDDKPLTNAGDIDVMSGGTYDSGTNKVTGEVNTDLVLYWWVDITSNMVNRSRHFYLNANNLQTVSGNPSPWSIDKKNILVEVLTSPEDTAGMYINDGTPADNFMFIGSGEASSAIRTYIDRQADFMYASREYISLTMQRTFTFRQPARAVVKLTIKGVVGEAPVIDLTSGNELRLEAFASEIMDDYDDLPITNDTSDPDGTLWTFSENFEAPPKIFITPSVNTTTWVTDKSATSCRIHAADDCTVDVTARGR